MERQNIYRISLCLLLDILGSEPLPGDISACLGHLHTQTTVLEDGLCEE